MEKNLIIFFGVSVIPRISVFTNCRLFFIIFPPYIGYFRIYIIYYYTTTYYIYTTTTSTSPLYRRHVIELIHIIYKKKKKITENQAD